MKKLTFVSLCLLFAALGAFAGIGEHVPSSSTVEEANDQLQARKDYLIDYYSKVRLARSQWGVNHNRFAQPILAKLVSKTQVEEINELFMQPALLPYAKSGTDITVIPGLCSRKGDYDFMLQNLVRILYEGRANETLEFQTQYRILNKLLDQRGGKHYKIFFLGLCGWHKDTENHLLMTETSRYLTNQMLLKDVFVPPWERDLYDNTKLDFHNWMLKHLKQFFVDHFEEYNSKPYQGYTMFTINNLANYAEEPRVKLAATMLLDYLSAFYAVQSNGGRRISPFRRQPQFRDDSRSFRADAQAGVHAILSGNYQYLKNLDWKIQYGRHFALSFAVGDYKVPDIIQDVIIEKEHHDYFQVFNHDTPEIYHGSKSFLIGGGGIHRNFLDYGTKLQDGFAWPITLMPSDDSHDYKNWIRIEGHKKYKKQVNTCIAKNFACGSNPTIPNNIPKSCKEKVGDYTFFDFTNSNCPIAWDFHVAVMKKRCKKFKCKRAGKSFGFYEVQEAGTISYNDFKNNILKYNNKNKFKFKAKNGYLTSKGKMIIFEFNHKKWEYPIISYDGKSINRKIKKWPLAFGDIMQADKGLIEFTNQHLKKKLTLDMRNPLAPKKFEEKL